MWKGSWKERGIINEALSLVFFERSTRNSNKQREINESWKEFREIKKKEKKRDNGKGPVVF